ncbi:hypothetical protein SAMN05444166_7475 [Singulisphaera sp. GP187]|nr:hypothetical protein SAMN05444166_7475 [Singulisphaera sp. GP187]
MDRAWIVRLTFRRLILVAIAFQAMTPDLLDETWISQSLPPDALVAATSPTPSRKAFRFPSFPLESEAVPAESAAGNDSPENLCEPIWPELGLRLDRNGSTPAQLKPEVYLPRVPLTLGQAPAGLRLALDSAKTVLRSKLPLRLIC